MDTYTIRRTPAPPGLDGDASSETWRQANPLTINWFHPKSTDHRPRTEARLLYDDRHVYVLFTVRDRWVRSVTTDFNGPVCRDSCVEWFVEPLAGKGYFNFEINAGGTLHVSHVVDPTRTKQGFADYALLTPEEGARVRIYHSLQEVIEPEIEDDTDWAIEYAVPVDLLEHYVGPIGDVGGQTWRANFYKCGDGTSRPHWATWRPVGELNFHRPMDFGELCFEK